MDDSDSQIYAVIRDIRGHAIVYNSQSSRQDGGLLFGNKTESSGIKAISNSTVKS